VKHDVSVITLIKLRAGQPGFDVC